MADAPPAYVDAYPYPQVEQPSPIYSGAYTPYDASYTGQTQPGTYGEFQNPPSQYAQYPQSNQYSQYTQLYSPTSQQQPYLPSPAPEYSPYGQPQNVPYGQPISYEQPGVQFVAVAPPVAPPGAAPAAEPVPIAAPLPTPVPALAPRPAVSPLSIEEPKGPIDQRMLDKDGKVCAVCVALNKGNKDCCASENLYCRYCFWRTRCMDEKRNKKPWCRACCYPIDCFSEIICALCSPVLCAEMFCIYVCCEPCLCCCGLCCHIHLQPSCAYRACDVTGEVLRKSALYLLLFLAAGGGGE
jgi:hypothetical protein